MAGDFTELEALARNLTASGAQARTTASKAVRKAAQDVKAHAQRFAPVDTGNLRGAIHTRAEGELASAVISPVEYAVYQEFGTRFQPGTPHMRPALEQVEPTFVAAIGQIGDTLL